MALLRDAAGLRLQEVATRCGVAITTVHYALGRHTARMAADPAYDELVSSALRTGVRRSIANPPRALVLPMRVEKGADEPLVVQASAP